MTASNDMGTEQWLHNFRCIGRRRLDEPEIAACAARVNRELRWLRLAHRSSKLLSLAVIVVVGTYFALQPAREDSPPAFMFFAALGAMFVALGPIGTVLEVIFAPRRRERLIFGGAVVVFLVAWLLGGNFKARTPGFWEFVQIVDLCLVIVCGGAVALYVRLRSRPKRISQLSAAVLDVRAGEVLVFEHRGVARRLEVLPVSRLLYRAGDTVLDALEQVPIATLAVPPISRDPSRPLADPELAELAAARTRIRRAALSLVPFSIYATAVFLRLIELALHRWHGGSDLSALSWLLALLSGLYVAYREVRLLRALAADLERKTLARVQVRDITGVHIVEILPISKRVWSVDAQPASWRTVG